jgi:hypothetical protein
MMRKMLGLAVALALTTSVAQAQIEKGDKAVFVQGFVMSTSGTTFGNVGGGIKAFLTDHIGVSVSGSQDLAKNGQTTVSGGLELELAPRGSKTVPYLSALAMMTSGNGTSNSEFAPGAGLRAFMSRNASFFIDAKVYSISSGTASSTTVTIATFGIEYFIGKSR